MVLRLVNGPTVSAGGHNSTDYYDHSASLARFPCKLDLMPICCGLCKQTSAG